MFLPENLLLRIAADGGFFHDLFSSLMEIPPKSVATAYGCIKDHAVTTGWQVLLPFCLDCVCWVKIMFLIAVVDEICGELIGFLSKIPPESFAAADKCIEE